MANFVQLYKSTDLNSPVMTGQTGTLISLLNAILVNGYTVANVGNITRTSSLVTVVLAVANATLNTGNYVTIAGCDQTDYNGTFQITVVNSTTFTFTVSTTPVTPATTSSTITYKKAPLGWTLAYTGSNKAAYRSADVSSNRFYLQVYDNSGTAGGALEAAVRGYETMADVDTGTGAFPTASQQASGLCWRKSSSVDATVRPWTLIGDDKTFYIRLNDASYSQVFAFGHFISQKPGDGFNTFIIGNTTFNSAQNSGSINQGFSSAGTYFGTATGGVYFPRSYTQIGSSINGGMCNWIQNYWGYTTQVAFPHPPDGGAYFIQPVFHETVSGQNLIRGRIPGVYGHLHGVVYNQYDQLTGVTNLPGVTLTIFMYNGGTGSLCQIAFDTFGPWI